MKKKSLKLSTAMEDYLEAIFILSRERGFARTGEIAKHLKVSPSSVVEMVGRITRLGLAEWRRYEGIFLTPEGRVHGEVIHIRHETLRRFFEFIGVSPDIADDQACIIEHELSPVTTAAIGDLVRFLDTPAGGKTCSALKLFKKFQDAGISFEESVISQPEMSVECIQKSGIQNQEKMQILSSLTRHDLQNSLSAMYGYLDLLRDLDSDSRFDEIIIRMEKTASSMHRQISSSGELLIPGASARVWLNLGGITRSAAEMLSDQVTIQNNLHGVEVYGDPLIERVVYNLFDNALNHGGGVRNIVCDFQCDESGLIWIIRDDGQGINRDDKNRIFRPRTGSNSGMGLFMVDQILAACGMRIDETGQPGKGAEFQIRVPAPLYRMIHQISSGECDGSGKNCISAPVS